MVAPDLNIGEQLRDTPPPPDPIKVTSPGATAPASGVLSIKDQLRQASGATTTASGVRRGPGRPRKEPVPTTKTEAELLAEKVAAKRKRAEELKGKIAGEYNDYLLEFIVSQTPLTVSQIWLPGKEPKHDTDNRYTDLGGIMHVNEFMATSLAHFAAELEYSGVGQSVSGAVNAGPIGMILWGILSVASVGMYVKGINDVMKRLQVLQAAQERMAQGARTQQEGVML